MLSKAYSLERESVPALVRVLMVEEGERGGTGSSKENTRDGVRHRDLGRPRLESVVDEQVGVEGGDYVGEGGGRDLKGLH